MRKIRYEVIEGTRANPGRVLATFQGPQWKKVGGAATACLRWFHAESARNPTRPMFFRKVAY